MKQLASCVGWTEGPKCSSEEADETGTMIGTRLALTSRHLYLGSFLSTTIFFFMRVASVYHFPTVWKMFAYFSLCITTLQFPKSGRLFSVNGPRISVTHP